MKTTALQDLKIRNFIKEGKANGLDSFFIANIKMAREYRAFELRGGKITAKGEGKGVEVLAYAHDELGNVVALCRDGYTRQYLAG